MSVDLNVTEVTPAFSLAAVVREANDILKKWLNVNYDIPIIVGTWYRMADLVDLQTFSVDLPKVKQGNDVFLCVGTRDEELGFTDGFLFTVSRYPHDYRFEDDVHGEVYVGTTGFFRPISACLMLAITTATASLC